MTDKRSMPQIMDSIGQSLNNIIGDTGKVPMTPDEAIRRAKAFAATDFSVGDLAILIMQTYNEGELAGAENMGEHLVKVVA